MYTAMNCDSAQFNDLASNLQFPSGGADHNMLKDLILEPD
jgi:hypothetical protein